MPKMVKKAEVSGQKADDSATETEDEETPSTAEAESEEDAEEEVSPARPAGSGAPAGGGRESEGEADGGIREDIKWLKETLGTIVSGAQEQRGPAAKRPGGRTVVRVKQAPPKEPPPPPPPPRGTKRLTFGGFGLRKARRSQ